MNLNVDNISKRFDTVQALDCVSFSASGGRPLGLLGRNGAGKTTAMRIIMGIFEQDSGKVLVDGRPIDRAALKIGYLPEERGLYLGMTVTEQLCYFARLRGLSRADAQKACARWLDRLRMSDKASVKVGTLSKGNQQRIQLALALINDPQIVILDEPFSGLDPVNARQLRDIVSETAARGSVIIFSSHQMSAVENFCEDITILRGGVVALNGTLPEIRSHYPHDRVRVVFSDASREIGEKAAAEFGEAEHTRAGMIIKLNDAADRGALLAALVSAGADISVFEVAEPSLEDIFVQYAGKAPAEKAGNDEGGDGE